MVRCHYYCLYMYIICTSYRWVVGVVMPERMSRKIASDTSQKICATVKHTQTESHNRPSFWDILLRFELKHYSLETCLKEKQQLLFLFPHSDFRTTDLLYLVGNKGILAVKYDYIISLSGIAYLFQPPTVIVGREPFHAHQPWHSFLFPLARLVLHCAVLIQPVGQKN